MAARDDCGIRDPVVTRFSDANPGLARADRSRRGGFAALVSDAAQVPAAAHALADAYRALSVLDRRRLVDAVVADCHGDPAAPLAALLAVEDDPQVAAAIHRAMERSPADALAVSAPWALGGDRRITIVQPLHGPFVETLEVRWDDDEVAVEHDPLRRADDLGGRDAIDLGRALRTLTRVLWDHRRRGGTLPDGARRFAALF